MFLFAIFTQQIIAQNRCNTLSVENKIGITIDEYGKTNLYFEHIKLLNNLIYGQNEWNIIFKRAIEKKCGIIIEGD